MTAVVGTRRATLTIEIRTVDLSDHAPVDVRTLSEQERARAARFRHALHARRWIRARTALRWHLGVALGSPPEQLRFRSEPLGKPMLDGTQAHRFTFNLSHAADMAVIAWAHLPPGLDAPPLLGVDVEAVVAVPELEEVARHYFAPEERAALLALPLEERTFAFHRIWTRKEAFVKALGLGIGAPLDRFAVTLDHATAHVCRADSALFGPPESWAMAGWEPSPGYVAALAVRDAGVELHFAGVPALETPVPSAPC